MRSIGMFLIFFCLTTSAQIPKDKQYHLYAGATIGAWGMMTIDNQYLKPIYGIGWATIAGVGKELIDLGGFGTAEWKDIGATIIGGCISVGIITAIHGIFKNRKQNKYRMLVNGF